MKSVEYEFALVTRGRPVRVTFTTDLLRGNDAQAERAFQALVDFSREYVEQPLILRMLDALVRGEQVVIDRLTFRADGLVMKGGKRMLPWSAPPDVVVRKGDVSIDGWHASTAVTNAVLVRPLVMVCAARFGGGAP